MHLLALGLNHKTAPVSIRERVAFASEEIPKAINHLCSRADNDKNNTIDEIAFLSTCNRTEIYFVAKEPSVAKEAVLNFICDSKQVTRSELDPHIYAFEQEDVALHMFRVASGLNSMVLGETQIVGQMKKAEKIAATAKGLGTLLNHLFQTSFTVAKEVRTVTAIGENSISLAAAAVQSALRLFGSLKNERILFVGAGEMIELCAAHFAAQQPKSITIANRTLENGQALAQKCNGKTIRLADLPKQIADYDVIVSCTASALPIIGLGMIERAVGQRRHRPIFIVDLAVPRDVEAEIDQLPDVYVYTVDDLGKIIDQGMATRRAAVHEAEIIIEKHKLDFTSWLRQRKTVPAIKALRDRANELRQQEMLRAMHRLEHGEDPGEVLECLAYGLTNKLIHDPTVLLRDSADLTHDNRLMLEHVFEGFYRQRER